MGVLESIGNEFIKRYDKEIDKYFARGADKVIQKINEYTGAEYTAPATSRIDEFRNNITTNGGLQKTNQFRFNISIPTFISEEDGFGASFYNLGLSSGLPAYDNTLSLLCRSIEIPAKTFNTTEIKINGQRRVVPANYTWDNVTATFIDTNNCIVYNTIYSWMDAINNPATNTGRFYDDYISELKVDYLDKNNNILGYIRLTDAFPISLSRSALSYDDRSEMMLTKVTFTYTYQSNQDYSAQMLYNIFSNLTNGSVGNLFDKAKDLVKLYDPRKLIPNSLKAKTISGYEGTAKNDSIKLFGVRTKPIFGLGEGKQ